MSDNNIMSEITIETTTETVRVSTMIGECGVCFAELPSDANHAYTVCKHLFCISCLLKWYKANPSGTCPTCRASLFSKDSTEPGAEPDAAVNAGNDYDDYDSDEAFFEHAYLQEEEQTTLLIQELDFNQEEEGLHERMLAIISHHARNYCSNLVRSHCTYMGVVNIFNFPSNEYLRCDYGFTNPNCHYILVMRDASRAFRYKFGRIENIRADLVIEGVYWFDFRELTLNDYGYAWWDTQTQLISFEDVRILKQYIPRIRVFA